MTKHRTTPDTPAPAFRFGFTRDWPGYFAAVAGKGPRDTTTFALDRFVAEGIPDAGPDQSSENPPLAVDLGCGEGRDTQALLETGFRVVAIDGHTHGLDLLEQRPGIANHPRRRFLETRLAPFEECTIPRCTFLNASFALPFCHPDFFDALWRIIRFAIEPGGRFAGQLFGDRDTWATIPDRTHHTRIQAEKLLLGMDVEMFKEEEKDAADSEGNDKHWHVYHIVAKNPDE